MSVPLLHNLIYLLTVDCQLSGAQGHCTMSGPELQTVATEKDLGVHIDFSEVQEAGGLCSCKGKPSTGTPEAIILLH